MVVKQNPGGRPTKLCLNITSNSSSNSCNRCNMERRAFIQQCGILGTLCLGGMLLTESCVPTQHITAHVVDNQVKLPLSSFTHTKGGKTSYRKYVVVKPEGLSYPIVMYRFAEGQYSALLLQCSHQGNELNINGDLLTCPAHGSEFSNRGEVMTGPAEQKLKSFPVLIKDDNLYIQLAS